MFTIRNMKANIMLFSCINKPKVEVIKIRGRCQKNTRNFFIERNEGVFDFLIMNV